MILLAAKIIQPQPKIRGVEGESNSSVDYLDGNGNIKTRRWFGEDRLATRDVDMTNHGNPKLHPEWPHEHIGEWIDGIPYRH